jgi:hypothetical protein
VLAATTYALPPTCLAHQLPTHPQYNIVADPSFDIPDDDDSIFEDDNEYTSSQEDYIRSELAWALKYAAEAVRMVKCTPGMFEKPCDLRKHSGSRESELDEAPQDHIVNAPLRLNAIHADAPAAPRARYAARLPRRTERLGERVHH